MQRAPGSGAGKIEEKTTMSKKLQGKVAVVTGASLGIGAGIALRFAEEGAKVVVNYSRSADAANKVVSSIQAAGGEAVAVKANLSKRADIVALFAETKKVFGAADILVNNAGVFKFAPLGDITEEHFHQQFDVNVLGLLFASAEAVKHFAEKGETHGNIINISSVVGHTPSAPAGLVYSATKAAVENITRGLALELAGKVRVNAIAPGAVDTEGAREMGIDDSFREKVISRSAVKRLGVPDDIAKAAVFLASDDSSWISGETLIVGGGVRL
jgi:3-oxoacyl-[acyl-carrier protein] reductase